MGQPKKEMEILIEINGSFEAKAFEFEESFYQREIKRAARLLEKLVGRCEDRMERKTFSHHYHEAISVMGSRGLGKTSFMLTLQKYIQERATERELNKKLSFLPIIEPGMLEDAEYFLATLTSIICQKIQSYETVHEEKSISREWQDALKELCKNFIALDGSAYKKHMAKSFEYPEVLGNIALLQGCSGTMLAEKFHKFVDASIKYMRTLDSSKKDLTCFVFMIDDVDTAYDKAWIVMENIRKYLTTPQLIVVTSGDQDLFKLVIRNQLLKNSQVSALAFDQNLISKNDIALLKDVEWQYQLKIFPVLSRIVLPTAYTHILLNRNSIKLVKTAPSVATPVTETQQVSFNTVFASFMNQIYHYPSKHPLTKFEDANPYSYIIPGSNRVLLQLFKNVIIPSHSIPARDKNERITGIITKLKQLFANELNKAFFNPSMLENSNKYLLQYISDKLIRHNIQKKYHQSMLSLQPRAEYDSGDNKVIIILNALLSQRFAKNASSIFEFWFMFLNPIIDRAWLPEEKEKEEVTKPDSYRFSCENLPDLCAVRIRKIHYINANTQQPNFTTRRGPGFLKVLTEPKEAWGRLTGCKDDDTNINPWFSHVRNKLADSRISSLEEILPAWNDQSLKRIDKTTLSVLSPFILSVSDTAGSHPYVDFQRGISVISEIVKASVHSTTKKQRLQAIRSQLAIWHPLTIYPEIDTTVTYQSSQEQNSGTKEDIGSPEESIIFAIEQWLANDKKHLDRPHPVETYANIWSRVSKNIASFNRSIPDTNKWTVGKLLNGCVIAFLHSVLIEEMLLATNGNVDFIIPERIFGGDFVAFETNFSEVKDFKKYPLFTFWLNCPFINTLLSSDQVTALGKESLKNFNFEPFIYEWKWQISANTSISPSLHKGQRRSTAYRFLEGFLPASRLEEENTIKIEDVIDSMRDFFHFFKIELKENDKKRLVKEAYHVTKTKFDPENKKKLKELSLKLTE